MFGEKLEHKAKGKPVHLPFDIRMEWVVSEAIQDDEERLHKIFLQPYGAHHRGAHGDISSYQMKTQQGGVEQLAIGLNREGLYDQLPEYLFHEYDRSYDGSSRHNIPQRLDSVVKERELARKFFYPLDCQFQRLRARIFHIKRIACYEVKNTDWTARTLRWLGLDPDLFTEKERELIIELIPRIHDLSGHLQLIADWVSHFLAARVEIRTLNLMPTPISLRDISRLGRRNARLGRDFLIGSEIPYGFFRIGLLITNLQREELRAHINKDITKRKLTEIFRFLLPLNVIYQITFICRESEKDFALKTADKPLLGYGTRLSSAA